MMDRPVKIKVLFQLNELAYSGTTKAIFTFLRHLDRNRFEPFLFYPEKPRNFKYRRLQFEALFSKRARFRFQERYFISQVRRPELESLIGTDHIRSGNWQDFKNFVAEIEPDIIHFSRGDEIDWYTENIEELPNSIVIAETSIFGKSAGAAYLRRLDLVFLISEWVKSKTPWFSEKGRSLHLPILAEFDQQNLRKRLGIGDTELVVGRISRPGLDSGEAVLKIFKKLKTPCRLLVLGGGPDVLNGNESGLVLTHLPETTDEVELSRFYNTIDVLLHYRIEGETFGMSIADAMIRGKPVVSHLSYLDNSQVELLAPNSTSPCGFVVEENHFDDHAAKIDLLLTDATLRQKMGKAAKMRAEQLFDAQAVTKKLEQEYLASLERKGRSVSR